MYRFPIVRSFGPRFSLLLLAMVRKISTDNPNPNRFACMCFFVLSLWLSSSFFLGLRISSRQRSVNCPDTSHIYVCGVDEPYCFAQPAIKSKMGKIDKKSFD